ncbi:single-stranded DNA-binding protein [Marispirochaeta aestuarii]|uniref:single-stranded DNA-binding protein n=1 Tax=Marispirochaeta aestuarii TaxID=1963862 RepID=UPI002ABE19EB|nr:single-stranded DNA-binding protein [Marispirochaeta aestuarii]
MASYSISNLMSLNMALFPIKNEKRDLTQSIWTETWADTAETRAKVLKKGRGVRIFGRLKQDRWEDAEGKTQYRIKIVADRVEFRPQFNKTGKSDDAEDGASEDPPEDRQQVMAEVF